MDTDLESHKHEQQIQTDPTSDVEDVELDDVQAGVKASPAVSPATKKRSFSEILLRFASKQDKVLMALGLLAAAAAGSAQPLMTIVFGQLSDSLGSYALGRISASDVQADVNAKTLYFVYIAIGIVITTYVYVGTFTYTAENAASLLRKTYLQSVLRQDIAFFDNEGGGSVSTRIITDTQLFQDGVGEKVPMLVLNLSVFVIAFIVAFSTSPLLTAVLLCSIPTMAVVVGLFRKYIVVLTRRELDNYAAAGNVAEEGLAAIRTVTAFMAHKNLRNLYRKLLLKAEEAGIKKQILLGVVIGLFQLIVYSTYSLAFYYGGHLLANNSLTPGQILTCFFSVIIGAFSVAGSSGEIQAIGFAIGAGSLLFDTIDRAPAIDSYSEQGKKLEKVEGKFVVENVSFRYPSRPDVLAVSEMSLEIEAGQTVALVGSSGSGKSTIVQLIERFYDPTHGRVLMDGVDLREINLKWLRRQIGYVTQNVAHGLIGTLLENSSQEEKMTVIVDACTKANAHDFIMKLPDRYNTKIGERGLLLSGGQKQRIAIARAIVKDPRILLLDEATSALDTHSEKIVQEALDRASNGRTTIVIAHRLSTIRDASKIIVMDKGKIVEVGTHKSLMAMESGYYRKLVEAQDLKISQSQKAAAVVAKQDPDDIKLSKPAANDNSDLVEVKVDKLPVDSQESSRYNKSFWMIFYQVMTLNRPEIFYIIGGSLGSFLAGAIMPVFAILFGNVLQVLYEHGQQLQDDVSFWALMFFVISIVGMVSNMMKFSLFGISGEKLTTRIRDLSFGAMLNQEIGWFDEEKNSVGSLTSSLSFNAQQIQNMSGSTLGSMLELAVSVVGAAVVSLSFGWKLALAVLACLPLLIYANKLRMDTMRKGNVITKEYYEKTAQIACEAVASMRTVAALTREEDVLRLYSDGLMEPLRIGHHHAYVGSLLFAVSQSFSFLMNALAFWYGMHLFINEGYDIKQMFVVLMSSIFVGQSTGRVFSMMPDLSRSQIYAQDMLDLVHRRTRIDSYASGVVKKREEIRGQIEFKNVRFEYPTRPGIPVLRGLTLTAKPGQFIALVGSSGCGKSTTIGLVERFYDISGGQLTIDDVSIREWDLGALRKTMLLVSQEPSLFNVSIRDNIRLGVVPGSAEDTDAAMIRAAQDANIHDFVQSLPQGYDTLAGGKGSQLSGGQKQRIAIARALILNPRILLLDEATSALDAQSEKVVQETLDEAAKGRTTISIAHRLSTIKDADRIYVLTDGVVVEEGTHKELMELNGLYSSLARQQDLQV